jgi:hypothetical protein
MPAPGGSSPGTALPDRVNAKPGLARQRVPVLALAAASLLGGLAGGLARLGAGTPSPTGAAAGHGVLMTLGFLGTLIALERAVALRHAWGYLAPVLSGVGGLAIIAGVPAPWPPLLMAAAGAWLCAGYLVMWQRQPTLHITVEALGALAWWGGAMCWLAGTDLPGLAPWLAAFVVLTIAGERLELAWVVLLGRRYRDAVLVWSSLILVGPALTMAWPSAGARVLGAGLLMLSAWLVRYDVARHTVRAHGLTRYMAVCLLTGYVWLAVAALTWVWHGALTQGPAYDAALHAVFFGFAMSMVLGHAPVILPAVLRVRLPHHRRDYAVLVVLHLSLALRIVGGDLGQVEWLRLGGGILGVVALLAFVANSAGSAYGARRATRSSHPPEQPPHVDHTTPAPGGPWMTIPVRPATGPPGRRRSRPRARVLAGRGRCGWSPSKPADCWSPCPAR